MERTPVTPDFSPPAPPVVPVPIIPPPPPPPSVPGQSTQYLIIAVVSPFYLAGGLLAMAAFDRERVTASVVALVVLASLYFLSNRLARLPRDRRFLGVRAPIWLALCLLSFALGFLSYVFLEYDAHRRHHRFE